jgi:hypothetical protein
MFSPTKQQEGSDELYPIGSARIAGLHACRSNHRGTISCTEIPLSVLQVPRLRQLAQEVKHLARSRLVGCFQLSVYATFCISVEPEEVTRCGLSTLFW